MRYSTLSAVEDFSTIDPSDVWKDTNLGFHWVLPTESDSPISVIVTKASDLPICVTAMPQVLSHKGVDGSYKEVAARFAKCEQAMVTMDGLNRILGLVKTETQRAKDLGFHES